jgi:hypothetical protein
MKRWLLNFAVLMALVLCAAFCVMWRRSHFRYDALYLTRVIGPEERPVRRFFHVRSSLGRVSLCYTYQNCVRDFMNPRDRKLIGVGWVKTTTISPPAAIGFGGGWLGFESKFDSDVQRAQTRYERVIIVPHWFFAFLFMVPTIFWVRQSFKRRQTRRRQERGLCLQCGYDLRGSKERCPECGTSAKPQTAGAS